MCTVPICGFFPLALSYLLPLEIVLNIVRCRPCVRAQCEGEKEGSEKGATLVSCHRLDAASVCNQRGSPGAVYGCLAKGCCGWQRGSVLSSSHLLGTSGWSSLKSKQECCLGLLRDLGVAPKPWNAGYVPFLRFLVTE